MVLPPVDMLHLESRQRALVIVTPFLSLFPL